MCLDSLKWALPEIKGGHYCNMEGVYLHITVLGNPLHILQKVVFMFHCSPDIARAENGSKEVVVHLQLEFTRLSEFELLAI